MMSCFHHHLALQGWEKRAKNSSPFEVINQSEAQKDILNSNLRLLLARYHARANVDIALTYIKRESMRRRREKKNKVVEIVARINDSYKFPSSLDSS